MEEILNYFGGIPFLSEKTNVIGVLSAVVASRKLKDRMNKSTLDLKLYLDPYIAYSVLLEFNGPHAEVSYTDMPKVKLNFIKESIEKVSLLIPEWKILFKLPVKFKMLLDDNLVSLTNGTITQHIFLGNKAFYNEIYLQECIVHEYSHIWMFLLNEIEPFVKSNNQLFILPSGTKDKDAKSVILAAAFAASVIKFYNCKGLIFDMKEDRLNYLKEYLGGCLFLLHDYEFFTPLGADVYKELVKFKEGL